VLLLLLLVNGTIGFVEDHSANNAVDALRAVLAPVANVKRDGNWTRLPARELVPGDVISVKLGDVVPADGLLQARAAVAISQ
jgi:H+-transporting ATPase